MKCFVCKKEIKSWRNNKNKKYFCSRECYFKSHKVGAIKCELCGKLFYPKYKKRKFCSKSCSSKVNGYNKGHKLSKKSIKKMSETKLSKSKYKNKKAICKNCGKEFEFRQNKKCMVRVFCSNKCRLETGGRKGHPLSKEKAKELSKKYTGKNNPCWKGGLSKNRLPLYKGREYREWRKAVFERDNYTCQICKQKGVKLEADHIIPWCKYKDGWFDINNGRTLCKKCHKEITRKFMKENWVNQYS